MEYIVITKHDKEGYKNLVELAFKYCDKAYLVERFDLRTSEIERIKITDFLNLLSNSRVDVVESNAWPGTTIYESKATISLFQVK